MKISLFSRITSAAFIASILCLQPQVAQAGGQGFSKEVVDSKGYDPGVGKFTSFPFHVTVSVRGGYDDNVNLTTFDPVESWFTNFGVDMRYDFGGPRTQLSLNVGGGITYYFDRNEDDEFVDLGDDDFEDYDFNFHAGFSIVHKATPRLTLSATLYASYQSQPDFDTFNSSTVTVGRQSQDFFFSSNRFAVGYLWTPRFATATSYTLGIINYDDEAVSLFEDRWEHTFGNEFRFLVLPTTTVVAEYRFGVVDYADARNRESTSHYLLAGVDHSFSPRFNMSARGGVEFRDFAFDGLGLNGERDRTAPYFEGTVNYALAQGTSISWTSRYSLEEPDVPDSFSRQTFRTALSVRHQFTARIAAGLNLAYQHDDNHGSTFAPGFDEDSFDISLSVRYAINRNWALDAGYHHTQVVSDEALFREYSRNRIFFGASFTF